MVMTDDIQPGIRGYSRECIRLMILRGYIRGYTRLGAGTRGSSTTDGAAATAGAAAAAVSSTVRTAGAGAEADLAAALATPATA